MLAYTQFNLKTCNHALIYRMAMHRKPERMVFSGSQTIILVIILTVITVCYIPTLGDFSIECRQFLMPHLYLAPR